MRSVSPNGELLLFPQREVTKKRCAKPIARSEGRMLIGSTSVGLLGESWEFTGEFHQVIPPHSAAGFADPRANATDQGSFRLACQRMWQGVEFAQVCGGMMYHWTLIAQPDRHNDPSCAISGSWGSRCTRAFEFDNLLWLLSSRRK